MLAQFWQLFPVTRLLFPSENLRTAESHYLPIKNEGWNHATDPDDHDRQQSIQIRPSEEHSCVGPTRRAPATIATAKVGPLVSSQQFAERPDWALARHLYPQNACRLNRALTTRSATVAIFEATLIVKLIRSTRKREHDRLKGNPPILIGHLPPSVIQGNGLSIFTR